MKTTCTYYLIERNLKKILFSSVLLLNTLAFAGGDGSGGGFSCKFDEDKRILLDLIDHNPNYTDEFAPENPKAGKIEIGEAWKKMGFMTAMAESGKQNIDVVKKRLNSIMHQISYETSPITYNVLSGSLNEILSSVRLTKYTVFSKEDFVLSDLNTCKEPQPIGYYTRLAGLTLNADIFNQLGFKSRVGFLLHEVLRHIQFNLAGKINLTTKDIQDLVYEALEKKYTQPNSKWKNTFIFPYLETDKLLITEASKITQDICSANFELLKKAQEQLDQSQLICRNYLQNYIQKLNNFSKLQKTLCKSNSLEKPVLRMTLKSGYDVLHVSPLEDSYYGHKIYGSYFDDVNHDMHYIKSFKCDAEPDVKSFLAQEWNFLFSYYYVYDPLRVEYQQSQFQVMEQISYVGQLKTSGKELIFKGVEAYVSLILRLQNVSKNQTYKKLKEEFTVSDEQLNEFVAAVHANMADSSRPYPSIETMQKAEWLLRASFGNRSDLSIEELEGKATYLLSLFIISPMLPK